MPARSRHGRWACSCFRVSPVRRCIASLLAARRMSGMAIGVVGALVLGWAELANIWTGTANGPAARSTALAAGWTLIAVVFAHSRWPALFLAGVVGLVAGAVALGAAGEVGIVAVAAAVCAALTLGWIERSRRNWTARPRRGIALVFLSLLAGTAATGAVLLQAHKDPRDPALVAQGRQFPGIKPPWTDPLATASDSLSGRQRTPQGPDAVRPSPKPNLARPRSQPRSRQPSRIRPGPAAYVTVDLVLRGRRARARRAHPHRVGRGAPALHAIGMATGAAATGGRRACRPGHRCVGMDANAARGVPAAAGRRRSRPTWSSPAVQRRSPGRRLHAAAGARGGDDDSGLRTRAVAGRSRVAAAWTAAGRAYESARELLSRSGRARLAFRGPASARRCQRTRTRSSSSAGRLTMTQAAIIMAASGLVLCFAILAGFGAARAPCELCRLDKAGHRVSTSHRP